MVCILICFGGLDVVEEYVGNLVVVFNSIVGNLGHFGLDPFLQNGFPFLIFGFLPSSHIFFLFGHFLLSSLVFPLVHLLTGHLGLDKSEQVAPYVGVSPFLQTLVFLGHLHLFFVLIPSPTAESKHTIRKVVDMSIVQLLIQLYLGKDQIIRLIRPQYKVPSFKPNKN